MTSASDGLVPGLGSVEAMVAAFRDTSVMAVATEGPEHRFVAANEVVRQFANGRDLLGLPFAEVLPDASGQGFDSLFTSVYETGAPVHNHNWRVQLDLPEGGFTEFYASFSLAPWRAEDGSIRGVVGHAIDVTAEVRGREHAEAEAARAERRYRDARELVLELQDSLLPHAFPVVPGVQSAGRYLLAAEDTAAGGDWLDVIVLPNGHLALVVGDVVGHGVAASALMGQLRAVLGERLAAGADIAGALEALDRVADRTLEAHATTVMVADLDPATGELTYCTAGHPPPLVLAGEQSHYLPPTGAGPLASGLGFPVAHALLDEGAVVLLYSDGIIERPGRTPAQGTLDLARAARHSAEGTAFRDQALPVDRVCAQTIEMLVRETGHSDDITLLAVQRVPLPIKVELAAQVAPELPGQARTLIAQWLETFDASDNDSFALQLAIVECVTNVLDHAYSDTDTDTDTDRPVEVTARLEETGHAVIRIADHGRWRTIPGPDAEDRGRGLMMVTQMIDQVTVDRLTVDRLTVDDSTLDPSRPGSDSKTSNEEYTGTVVTLRHALTRPIPVIKHSPAPQRARRGHDEPFRTERDGSVLRVHGPVDALAADTLRADLLQLANGRYPHATVDLTGVTILASAGVQVLLEVMASIEQNQQVELTLRTPADSAAHQVLELTHLPHSP